MRHRIPERAVSSTSAASSRIGLWWATNAITRRRHWVRRTAGLVMVGLVGLQVAAWANDAPHDLAGSRTAPRSLGSSAACPQLAGTWGDATGDNTLNIIDAQQIARATVGLSVANATAVVAFGDVTGDNVVNIIDAQQIARFSVGLTSPVRTNTAASVPQPVMNLVIAGTLSTSPGGTTQLSTTPQDANNVSLNGCATVTWSTSDPNKATVDATTGLVTGVAAGTANIIATAVTIPPSAGGKVSQVTVTIAATNAASIAVNAGDNQFVAAGSTAPTAPSVIVKDGANAPVANVGVTFAVASGGGSITGGNATTNANGIATVGSWTLGAATGANTLTATIAGAGITGNPVTFTATGIPGMPATISVVSGDNQVQQQNVAFIAPLTVVVKDAANHPVGGAAVTFTVTSGFGSFGGNPTTVATTDGNGFASALRIAGPLGAQAATATVGALPQVTFNGRAVAAINGHARCELTSTSAAYCWGDNARGQIGDGTTANRFIPTAVSGGVTFASLAEGAADHACGLTVAGQAYCWGSNAYGELGDGTIIDRSAPAPVSGALTFSQLVVSDNATCGLSAGDIVCWGSAAYGLYGDGVQGTIHTTPTTVAAGGVKFTSIAIEPAHACAVATGGAAYCWGNGVNGRLGDGTSTTHTSPTAVGDGRTYTAIGVGSQGQSCGLVTGGAAFCWGTGLNGEVGAGVPANAPSPVPVSGGLTFASISVASASVCARTAANQVYCWGFNGSGQLGDGTATQRLVPTAVVNGYAFTTVRVRGSSGGLTTTCARTASGQPFCWGYNLQGQVGDGTTTNRSMPQPVKWVEGTPGAPVAIAVNAGNNQTAVPGAAVAIAPSVLVVDYALNPIVGANVTFAVASGGGSVTGALSSTDAFGHAAVGSWTLGSGGINTLTATTPGLPPLTFTATASGSAASVALVSGDNQYQSVGSTFVAPPTVIVKDAANNPVAGVVVSFAAVSGGGSITASVVTSPAGVASANWVANSTPGIQTATATVTGLPSVTFTSTAVLNLNGYGRCELKTTGAAYCWGDNTHGQVGDGTTTTRTAPTPVSGGLVFTSLAEGAADHACGLTAGGQAYCWGSNELGQIGDGTLTDRSSPVPVSGGLTFTQLVVSVNATCGRTAAGALYCWGWAGYGLYGDGVQGVIHQSPTVVASGGVTFGSVALGSFDACAISSAGTMYCWGLGTSGQIGDGANTTRTAPTAVPDGRTYTSVTLGTSFACGLATGGAAYCWGFGTSGQLGNGATTTVPSPVAVSGGLTFTAISSASNTTCAIAGGKPYCWGVNGNNQLGDGTLTTRPAPTLVAGGLTLQSVRLRNFSSCGRASSGQPFCWGYNGFGQLGDGTFTQRAVPVPVNWVEGTPGVAASLVVAAGDNQGAAAGSAVPVAPSVLVRDYAGTPVNGASVAFVVSSGGGSITGGTTTTNSSGIATLGSWTLGSSLGTNTLTVTVSGLSNVALPFSATSTTGPASIALYAGDTQVQLTNNFFVVAPTVIVRDASNNAITGVSVTFTVTGGGGSVGGSTSFSTTTSTGLASTSWVAGPTAGAQTITASVAGLSPVTFTGRSVVTVNDYARCELTSLGAAYCWGDNTHGQVGDNTTTSRNAPTAVGGGLTFTSLGEGSAAHACGLTAGGQAYCWGFNGFGQLGDGTTTDRSLPVQVGGGLTFAQLVVSENSTCGRTSGGALYCWGWAGYGLYGNGEQGTVHTSPFQVSAGGVTFTAIALGSQHACAIATGGTIYCWGQGGSGQLGTGFVTRTVPTALTDGRAYAVVAVSSSHTCGVTTAGAGFCWGNGGNGQLGQGTTSSSSLPIAVSGGLTFASISAAASYTCGLTTAGQPHCWGLNSNNQLGDGTTTQRLVPTLVQGGITFASVRVRNVTACARTAGGQPYCWGYNGFGQIGDATFTQRSTPVPVKWVEGIPGVAVSLVVNAGNGQSATVGTAVAVLPSVIVRDYANNPVAGASVTFAVASGGGSLTGATTTTNASGIATLGSWTLGPNVGPNTVTASAAGLPTPTFTATGTTATFSSLSLVSGNTQATTPGATFIAPLTVLVKDVSNNPVSGATVMFTVTGGTGNFSGSTAIGAITNASGLASAFFTTDGTIGPQTATATLPGLPAVAFAGRTVGYTNAYGRCELTNPGGAYCWGDNGHGQIGDGTTTTRSVPTAVGGGLTFASLAEGSADHACGLTAGGQAYCWGYNAYGQLGDGTIVDRSGPVPVGGGLTFVQLVVSPIATCGRTSAGSLFCWGGAGWGLYGNGEQGIIHALPLQVSAGGVTFTDVAIQQDAACAVASSGTMYCWGYGGNGQLGNGSSATQAAPTALTDGRIYSKVVLGSSHACGLTTANAAFCWGQGGNGQLGQGINSTSFSPVAVSGGLVFASMSASNLYTCARTAGGQLYCWGYNGQGQIGDGTFTQRSAPTPVFGGISFTSIRVRGYVTGFGTSCGRVANGQPYCWGYNGFGQIGDGTFTQRTTPVPVKWVEGTLGVAASLVINAGIGQSATIGTSVSVLPSVIVRDYANNPVAGVSVTFAVASGGGSITGATTTTNAFGIATIGSWTLGPNLGANTLTATAAGLPTPTFTATGTTATFTSLSPVVGDAQVQATNLQFIVPLTVLVQNAGSPVSGAAVVFTVTAGGGSIGGGTTISALTNASGLASAFWFPGGTIGAQTATASLPGLPTVTFNARSVPVAGGNGRCELTSAGVAYCWGDNFHGQVGDGTTANRIVPTPVAGGLTFTSLADGSADHACGLVAGGQAYCWGFNGYGQLGDGSIIDRAVPAPVSGAFTFTQLAVTENATCGITSAGGLVCWGSAGYGLYGDGVQGVVHLTPTPVNAPGLTFTSIAMAAQHYCGIVSGGSAYCWGNGGSGRLGDGLNTTHTSPTLVPDGRTYTSITVSSSGHSCGVASGGAGFCWGNNGNGQLGTGGTGSASVPTAVTGGLTFSSISTAGINACGRTTSSQVYCWGYNVFGSIGDGTTTQRVAPTLVQGSMAFASIRLRVGNFTGTAACARTAAGQPYCWGYNGVGNLGDGSTTNRFAPVAVNWVEGTPGVPVSLVVGVGNNQSAVNGTAVPTPPSVVVRDFAGNPVSGVSVTFAIASGGGSVTNAVVPTNGSGIATVGSWTLGTIGANTLTASANGLPTVTFTATATP